MKKELASGNGTASSFSCRSAIGLGRGLMGISGSTSSSSPTIWEKQVIKNRLFIDLSGTTGEGILCLSEVLCVTWEVIGREGILHFIDIGLELINFKLTQTKSTDNNYNVCE